MPEAKALPPLQRTLQETSRGAQASILRANPAKLLVLSYASFMLFGWVLLSLPLSQAQPISPIDTLFTAVSAVSTTGLVTVDPGTSYTFLGQLVLLLLFQAGGVGYMTIGSFSVLATQERLSRIGEKVAKAEFALPADCHPTAFIRTVLLYTLVCETLGAGALYLIFSDAGESNALWNAIFHSISAFCTAGFSLNADSFIGYRDHTGLNVVIAMLSLSGAMGFLIVWDMWRNLTSRAFHLGFTSKVIIRMTFAFLVLGTLVFLVAEPTLADLPPHQRLQTAFFQAMSASTTVGFNSHPLSALSYATLIVLFLLMAVGASPSGTGGGLKTTTFAAMLGLLRSTVKQRDEISFANRHIRPARMQAAAASCAFFAVLLFSAMFVLGLTEQGIALEALVFESISALGTVGLSLGATGDLSVLGKLTIMTLMTAGRVGILTFGIALAMHEETPEEVEDDELLF